MPLRSSLFQDYEKYTSEPLGVRARRMVNQETGFDELYPHLAKARSGLGSMLGSSRRKVAHAMADELGDMVRDVRELGLDWSLGEGFEYVQDLAASMQKRYEDNVNEVMVVWTPGSNVAPGVIDRFLGVRLLFEDDDQLRAGANSSSCVRAIHVKGSGSHDKNKNGVKIVGEASSGPANSTQLWRRLQKGTDLTLAFPDHRYDTGVMQRNSVGSGAGDFQVTVSPSVLSADEWRNAGNPLTRRLLLADAVLVAGADDAGAYGRAVLMGLSCAAAEIAHTKHEAEAFVSRVHSPDTQDAFLRHRTAKVVDGMSRTANMVSVRLQPYERQLLYDIDQHERQFEADLRSADEVAALGEDVLGTARRATTGVQKQAYEDAIHSMVRRWMPPTQPHRIVAAFESSISRQEYAFSTASLEEWADHVLRRFRNHSSYQFFAHNWTHHDEFRELNDMLERVLATLPPDITATVMRHSAITPDRVDEAMLAPLKQSIVFELQQVPGYSAWIAEGGWVLGSLSTLISLTITSVLPHEPAFILFSIPLAVMIYMGTRLRYRLGMAARICDATRSAGRETLKHTLLDSYKWRELSTSAMRRIVADSMVLVAEQVQLRLSDLRAHIEQLEAVGLALLGKLATLHSLRQRFDHLRDLDHIVQRHSLAL